jgi:predicted metal-dependent HD superfamily phosphohydrolase
MYTQTLQHVIAEIDRIFEEEISEVFVYHNKAHTESVVNNCAQFALHYDLELKDRQLLAIAAWFHDVGYARSYFNHEENSVQMARSFLEKHSISEEDMDKISACILATKVETPPNNLLEEIIKDADLANLGENSFFDHSRRLRQEWLTILNEQYSDKSWIDMNHHFMTRHQYFTAIAREKLEEKKAENMRALEEERQTL